MAPRQDTHGVVADRDAAARCPATFPVFGVDVVPQVGLDPLGGGGVVDAVLAPVLRERSERDLPGLRVDVGAVRELRRDLRRVDLGFRLLGE
jgi:hypothetical protein